MKCSANIDSEKYISYFTDCVFELPDDNFFLEFNDLFCEFTMNLNLINDAGEFDKYWNKLRPVIICFWLTFACGIKVKVSDCADLWKAEFKKLENILKRLVERTDDLIELKPAKPYTEFEKKIMYVISRAYFEKL